MVFIAIFLAFLQPRLGEPLRRGRSLPPGDFVYGAKQIGSKNGVADGESYYHSTVFIGIQEGERCQYDVTWFNSAMF